MDTSIDALQQRVEELIKAATETNQRVTSIAKENSQLKKTIEMLANSEDEAPAHHLRVEELIKAATETNQRVDSIAKENTQLKKTIEMLTKPAGEAPPMPKIPSESFTVDGHTYKFCTARFKLFNKKKNESVFITAEDALTDEDLLAHLVAIGSGVIQEVAE